MLIEGYSDLALEVPGCHPGVVFYRAEFKLDADVTHLFPYINAAVESAMYYDAPHHIQFSLEGYRCALYPEKVVAALFEDRRQAVEFITRLTHFLNDLHARKDSIEADHKKYAPLPVLGVFQLLPRSNCAECGYPTCMAFAAALSRGETDAVKCPELNNPTSKDSMKLIALIECS